MDYDVWKLLVNGADPADLAAMGLLPTAERLADIPEGRATGFIDNGQDVGWPTPTDAAVAARQEAGGYDGDTIQAAAPVAVWVAFASSWIEMARWEMSFGSLDIGSLYVEFLSGAVVAYRGIPVSKWWDLCGSQSKGKWLYYTLAYPSGPTPGQGWPYELLRAPFRKVTAAMAKKAQTRTREEALGRVT